MFTDRREAGKQLAHKLQTYASCDVVLALPRGGVVTGYEIARALDLPLDIVTVRKIGHPGNSEFAIGAVDERGNTLWGDAGTGSVDPVWLKEETKRQQTEALRRAKLYRGGQKPLPLKGKAVILVDDGVATGLTMRLAIRSIQEQKPTRVIVAVPVSPPESVGDLAAEGADEIIVLEPPERFLGAVGAHYIRFDQVEDAEVIRLMELARTVR